MTANIDGVRWTTTRPLWSQRLNLTTIGGSDASRGSLFTFTIDGATVGTHHVTNDENARVFAFYSEGAVGGPAWVAGAFSLSTGTLTITRSTDREIAGTFEFVLQPTASMGFGAASSPKTITDGEFAVRR